MEVQLQKAYQELDLDPQLDTILITGGSLGAEIINQNVIELYNYALKNNFQILHLTGKNNYDRMAEELKKIT